MASVTGRINQIKQPRGGYLPPKHFEKIILPSENALYADESVAPGIVGTVVDYLSRFLMSNDKRDAFSIPLKGAKNLNMLTTAYQLLENVKGRDKTSIISACKLAGFDVAYRKGPLYYKPIEQIEPDAYTIFNIREMINRSEGFFKNYGPLTMDGFTLDGAYTDFITVADGDFITYDTLWDFKVSKSPLKKEHTLQILVYYLMGIRSNNQDVFKDIHYLGLFNPRQNTVQYIAVNDIKADVFKTVEREVIGY